MYYFLSLYAVLPGLCPNKSKYRLINLIVSKDLDLSFGGDKRLIVKVKVQMSLP